MNGFCNVNEAGAGLAKKPIRFTLHDNYLVEVMEK
jgi:hypothetical protein